MEIALNISIILVTFFLTEISAWANHKYVMHGSLWVLHKDHHVPHKGWFELNDMFFLMYAIPSWLLIMFGVMASWDFRVWVGAGIAFYGIAYFLVHDVLIHRRFKWLDKWDNVYVRAVRKAHKVHHKKMVKEEGECFGMLIVPSKYFKDSRNYFERRKAA